MQKYVLTDNKQQSANDVSVSAEDIQAEQIYALKHADYLAAVPSFGPLIKTQEITVTYQGDTATGTLTDDQAAPIQRGQAVILYDKEGFTLPLGGKVERIQPLEGITQGYNIHITLPEGTQTQYLLTEPDIIIQETTASKRLPLTAIQTDEDGISYIWIASPKSKDSDKKTTKMGIRRQNIKAGLSDTLYFEEAGHIIEAFDFVLLNPDSKIRANREYNIFMTDINAPLHNPIRQAWIDYELYKLEKQQAELTQIAEDCRNGKGSPRTAQQGDVTLPDGSTTPSAGSCGNTSGGTDPFTIFNAIINGNASGASACGTASCGQ